MNKEGETCFVKKYIYIFNKTSTIYIYRTAKSLIVKSQIVFGLCLQCLFHCQRHLYSISIICLMSNNVKYISYNIYRQRTIEREIFYYLNTLSDASVCCSNFPTKGSQLKIILCFLHGTSETRKVCILVKNNMYLCDGWSNQPGLTHLSLVCSPEPSTVLCALSIAIVLY